MRHCFKKMELVPFVSRSEIMMLAQYPSQTFHNSIYCRAFAASGLCRAHCPVPATAFPARDIHSYFLVQEPHVYAGSAAPDGQRKKSGLPQLILQPHGLLRRQRIRFIPSHQRKELLRKLFIGCCSRVRLTDCGRSAWEPFTRCPFCHSS